MNEPGENELLPEVASNLNLNTIFIGKVVGDCRPLRGEEMILEE